MNILVVGMLNSIHLARWVRQFKNLNNINLYIYPLEPVLPHKELIKIFFDSNSSKKNIRIVKLIPNIKLNFFIFKLLNIISFGFFNLLILYLTIKFIKFKFIHSLEISRSANLCLIIKKFLKKDFPKWIVTNWGSDIFYFYKNKSLKKNIKEIINLSDYYSAECYRDYKLAVKLGFKGNFLPCIPNSGGINLSLASKMRLVEKPSHRKLIVIKGYQDEIGQAINAILAIDKIIDKIQDFKIVIFSASPKITDFCKKIKLSSKIQLDIIESNTALSQTEMYNLFSKSRIYIGISKSDGISTSMLEAISLGAFPIQSNTSCGSEWIRNNISGFLVPWNDINIISKKILSVIHDNFLIEKSAKLNWTTIQKKGLDVNIKKIAHTFYEQ
jgi:glycosyltransferase involved in cell wall biosynthesis